MAAEGWRVIALRHAPPVPRLLAVIWSVALISLWAGVWRLRPSGVISLMLLSLAAMSTGWWVRWQRERAVREAPLPQFLKRKLRETYPHLSGKECELVERGLRQFFLACLRSRRQFVAMPSKAVDAMWHEFILHTRAYRDWCDTALGWFLHHTPAEALGPQAQGNDGLRRAWYWACRDEAIQPQRPTRLPLLFALDAKLAIAGGFHYAADCRDIAQKSAAGGDGVQAYCGTDFSSSGFSGDAEGLGGMAASSDGFSSDQRDGFSGGGSDSSEGFGGDGGADGGGCGGAGDGGGSSD